MTDINKELENNPDNDIQPEKRKGFRFKRMIAVIRAALVIGVATVGGTKVAENAGEVLKNENIVRLATDYSQDQTSINQLMTAPISSERIKAEVEKDPDIGSYEIGILYVGATEAFNRDIRVYWDKLENDFQKIRLEIDTTDMRQTDKSYLLDSMKTLEVEVKNFFADRENPPASMGTDKGKIYRAIDTEARSTFSPDNQIWRDVGELLDKQAYALKSEKLEALQAAILELMITLFGIGVVLKGTKIIEQRSALRKRDENSKNAMAQHQEDIFTTIPALPNDATASSKPITVEDLLRKQK